MTSLKSPLVWIAGGLVLLTALWLRLPDASRSGSRISGLLNTAPVFAQDKAADPEKADAAADSEKDGSAGDPAAEPPKEPTQAEKEAAAAEEMKLVLNGLEEKKQQLKEEGARIQGEAKRLEDLRAELDARIESLKELQQQIDKSLANLELQETEKEKERRIAEERKIAQLVKVYSSMKPKAAGAIVDNMDLEVAMKLFAKLKGEQAGSILSYVSSEKAAKITERLILSGQELEVPEAATAP